MVLSYTEPLIENLTFSYSYKDQRDALLEAYLCKLKLSIWCSTVSTEVYQIFLYQAVVYSVSISEELFQI